VKNPELDLDLDRKKDQTKDPKRIKNNGVKTMRKKFIFVFAIVILLTNVLYSQQVERKPWIFGNTVKFEQAITYSLTTGTAITVSGTPTKIISAGSYSSKIALPAGASTEMITIAGEGSEDDYYIGYGSYLRTTGEDGKGFGASFLVEATNTTGTPTVQGAQIMAFLGSVGGTEAAHLKTRDGDATAGLYALWLKTGANSNCVQDAGSRSAPLWVDNQMSGTLSGEEYGIFMTTGASRPTGAFGFETTSSGYNQLFYFDETFNSGAGTCVTTNAVPGGNQDARLNVYYNATQYYIPLYR
jgi:hypothetical protein